MRLYLKDFVTAGNFMAGFACALFAMRGDLVMAALMMPAAMFFDLSDGLVARWTKRFNRFGAELDNVADHMSYGVAPGFMLFAAYEPVFRAELGWPSWASQLAAFLVGGVPLFFASIRFARFNTYHYDTPGYWLGVPRPATGFALAALVNSHLFTLGLGARLAALVLVVLFGVLNASTFPYPNHHSPGRGPRIVWFYYFVFVGFTLAAILLGPILGRVPNQFLGDLILMAMGLYTFLGWLEVPGSARRMAAAAVAKAHATDDGAPVPAPEGAPKRAGGLTGHTAAGLAYVLGPVSGLYVLARRDPDDAFVGFHAWQATLTVVAVTVPYVGVWIVGGMTEALGLPNLLDVLRWPMAVFFGGYWLALMVGAFTGRKLKAPFIGWQSEKQLA